jgi:hypothetical protein
MSFDLDAFISYAHLDNCSLIEGHPGWITNLHRALELKVTQLLGKRPEIWRDPKLQGNDSFSLTILDRVRGAAVLITILSPCYVNSEWTRKELVEFWKTAEAQGGVVLHDKARIFKVLKTPVRRDMHPPELQSLLGYEFFEVDPDTKKVHELDEVFGNKAQISFWMKLDDLAQDICALLMELESFGVRQSSAVEAKPAIFLAEATIDIKEQREMIRRDLQQHGYTVLPAGGVPMVMAEAASSYRDDLARCRISIHPFGKNYGFIPEGSVKSIEEIQNELAIERGRQGDFSRLVWIQPGLAVEDERQKRLLEQLRTDPLVQAGADVLETRLEDLRTVIHDRLTKSQEPSPPVRHPVHGCEHCPQIYLIYDRRDASSSSAWADSLFDCGFDVVHPVFEGDEAEVRESHEENLRECDAAIIFYGKVNELWVRHKLRELQKSAGYGRTRPLRALAISLIDPENPEKQKFRTHDAMVITQPSDFDPERLQPFIAQLKS